MPRRTSAYRLLSAIASVIATLAIVVFFSACRRTEQLRTGAVFDRIKTPVLEAREVSTLISDSGITRYRINAQTWLVYDKDTPRHQVFPDGIYLEKFDEMLQVNASLKADYCYYNEDTQLWQLRGNVHALNLEGEQFDTQLLFWDQANERVYSDSAIKITRETSIIEGVGFESNQEMTRYTILNPTGVFPIRD